MEKDVSAEDLEQLKHQLAKELETHKHNLQIELKAVDLEREKFLIMMRTIVEYAQIAVRATVLVNGAGAVAILAYLARAGGALSHQIDFRAFGVAASVFGAGVACALFAAVFAYFSQHRTARAAQGGRSPIEFGKTWERRAGITCLLLGIACFVAGVFIGVSAYF